MAWRPASSTSVPNRVGASEGTPSPRIVLSMRTVTFVVALIPAASTETVEVPARVPLAV